MPSKWAKLFLILTKGEFFSLFIISFTNIKEYVRSPPVVGFKNVNQMFFTDFKETVKTF